MKGVSRYTVGGLVALGLWSTTMAMARSLSEQVGPLNAASSVYTVAGVICLLRLWLGSSRHGRVSALPPRYLFGCGFLFVAYAVLIYSAVGLARDRQQMLEVGLVNYLWPASTILLSLALLDKRASLALLPGTGLALAGIFLVMTQGAPLSWQSFLEHLKSNPVAYGFAFSAALVWALYSNLARRWSAAGGGGGVGAFIPATGVVLLTVSFFSPQPGVWHARALVEAGLLGVITAVAYALWDNAMRQGDLLLVAACSYFTPLLSTLVSCAYLKVVPGTKLWAGCAIIIVGSIVSWRSVWERQDRDAPVH